VSRSGDDAAYMSPGAFGGVGVERQRVRYAWHVAQGSGLLEHGRVLMSRTASLTSTCRRDDPAILYVAGFLSLPW